MSEKLDFSLMPLGIGSAFFHVIAKTEDNISWPFPAAESLAAELNAREEEFAKVKGERDATKQANDILAIQIARMTEELETRELLRKSSSKMVDGVWKDHEKQFAKQQEAIESLTAEWDRLRGIINYATTVCFQVIKSEYSTGHQIEFAEKVLTALSAKGGGDE